MQLGHKYYLELKKGIRDFFSYESIKSLLQIILVIIAFETFLFEPFKIPSGSMKPTLVAGDHVFAAKFAYGYSKYSIPSLVPLLENIIPANKGRIFLTPPKRGDIAIFRGTQVHTNSTNYIKRIIGLPGDKVQMLYGNLYINGKKMPNLKIDNTFDKEQNRLLTKYREELPNGVYYHIYKDRTSLLRMKPDTTEVFEVPQGHYFCLGDNRNGSADSRFPEMGFVPQENLVGKAVLLYWNTLEVWKAIKSIELGRLFTVF